MSGQLLHNLLLFGRILRGLGLVVNPGRMVDVVQALEHVQLGRRSDFYYALRSLLAQRREDLPLFDQAFELFWVKPTDGALLDLGALMRPRRTKPVFVPAPAAEPPPEDNADDAPPDPQAPPVVEVTQTFSTQELLRRKDFGDLSGAELEAIKQAKRSYCKARAMTAIPRRIGCVNPCLRRRLGNAAFTRARSADCCVTPESGCIRCSKVALWKITAVVLKTKPVGGCPKARVPHQAARRSHCKHFFNHERRRRYRCRRRFCRLCSFRRRRPGKRLFANYPYKFTIEIHPGLLFNKLAFTVHRRAIVNTRLGREVQVHATVWQCFKRQRFPPVPGAARSQIDFANFHAGCVCDSQRRRKFFLLDRHTLRSRLNNCRRRRCNFCSRYGSGLGSRCASTQNNGAGNQQGLQRVQLSQNLVCHLVPLFNTGRNIFGNQRGRTFCIRHKRQSLAQVPVTRQQQIAPQPGRHIRHQT